MVKNFWNWKYIPKLFPSGKIIWVAQKFVEKSSYKNFRAKTVFARKIRKKTPQPFKALCRKFQIHESTALGYKMGSKYWKYIRKIFHTYVGSFLVWNVIEKWYIFRGQNYSFCYWFERLCRSTALWFYAKIWNLKKCRFGLQKRGENV